ncbi:MAG: hypothetical protein K2J74_08370, partial [Muribaculaceae bacterium]|nr:hypothetical protein [Muribaculaceae bacterium]
VYSGEQAVFRRKISAQWSPMWVGGYYYKYLITLNGGNAGLDDIRFDGTIENPDGTTGWIDGPATGFQVSAD